MHLRLRGGGKPSAPKFTYDGEYVIRDDGVVELLTSGTLVFLDPSVIDVFCVGGGASGAYRTSGEPQRMGGGGGGGGHFISGVSPVISAGGAGGGGNGGWCGTSYGNTLSATSGVANTGGGGGGGAYHGSFYAAAGGGGSGIVCFRVAHELPELAGAWVLNERLYAPENNIDERVSFTAGESATGTHVQYNRIINGSDLTFYKPSGSGTTIYQYANNSWVIKYKHLIFPAGATASDEFRAWLASNATKQTA